VSRALRSTSSLFFLRLFFVDPLAANGRRSRPEAGTARTRTPPGCRHQILGPTRNRTGPVTAHKTFKNPSVYLGLVGSLGPHSTWLLGAVRWLWLRPSMRLGPAMFRSASRGRPPPPATSTHNQGGSSWSAEREALAAQSQHGPGPPGGACANTAVGSDGRLAFARPAQPDTARSLRRLFVCGLPKVFASNRSFYRFRRRRAAQLASYSLKHLLASYSRCIICFKHKQQATQPNNSALLACQHERVRCTHM
jgi:hypothetical protein